MILGNPLKFLFIVLSLTCLISIQAQALLIPENLDDVIHITGETEIGADQELIWTPYDKDFSNFKPADPKGIRSRYFEKEIWIKLELENPKAVDQELTIIFDTSLSALMELYTSENDFQSPIAITGSQLSWHERLYPSTFTVFPVLIKANQKVTYLWKRTGYQKFDCRIFISNQQGLHQFETKKLNILYLFVGAIFALFFYNLIIGYFTQQISMIYYSYFIFGIGSLSLNMQGILDQWFDHLKIPPSHLLFYFTCFALISSIQFSSFFLELKKNSPKVYRFHLLIMILTGILALYRIFFNHDWFEPYIGIVLDSLVLITSLAVLCSNIRESLKKNNLAILYLLAWGFLFIGVLIFYLAYYGVIERNTMTVYSIQWGALLEMLTISLALAYKINVLDAKAQVAEKHLFSKNRYQNLVRTLSHDIANPLTIIMQYTELFMLNPQKNSNKAPDFFQKIDRASKNISQIIARVRDQEKQIRDSIEIQSLQPVNLLDIISDSQFIFDTKLRQKNIQLKFQHDQINHYVLAEKTTLLNSVINNIISNAIKFSPENSKIDFSSEIINDKLILTIRDHGVGIKKEHLDKFYTSGIIQSQKGTSGETGTGYGLSLIFTYMELYQGEVKIESQTNENGNSDSGTRFILTFTYIANPQS